MNLELGAKRQRVYPVLTEGDRVKIMRKRGHFRKGTHFQLVGGHIYNQNN